MAHKEESDRYLGKSYSLLVPKESKSAESTSLVPGVASPERVVKINDIVDLIFHTILSARNLHDAEYGVLEPDGVDASLPLAHRRVHVHGPGLRAQPHRRQHRGHLLNLKQYERG